MDELRTKCNCRSSSLECFAIYVVEILWLCSFFRESKIDQITIGLIRRSLHDTSKVIIALLIELTILHIWERSILRICLNMIVTLMYWILSWGKSNIGNCLFIIGVIKFDWITMTNLVISSFQVGQPGGLSLFQRKLLFDAKLSPYYWSCKCAISYIGVALSDPFWWINSDSRIVSDIDIAIVDAPEWNRNSRAHRVSEGSQRLSLHTNANYKITNCSTFFQLISQIVVQCARKFITLSKFDISTCR